MNKKVISLIIGGGFILLLFIVIQFFISSIKNNKARTTSSTNSKQAFTNDTNQTTPTKSVVSQKETIDYNLILSKSLGFIETQKNNGFYNTSNNQKDINYQANSYLASMYFNLFKKTQDSKYINLSIDLVDSLKNHCLEKEKEKDCLYVLQPYYELYAYNKQPRYLEFINQTLPLAEEYPPTSFNAHINLSQQYLNSYLNSLDKAFYQKALSSYQEALNLFSQKQNQDDIGFLIQTQYMFYQITNDQAFLQTGNKYFSQFNNDLYTKMTATQKLFLLHGLYNFSSYKNLYDQLLSEFIKSNYNNNLGFVCYQSSDCGENGMSLIIDNGLFIDLINK